MSEPEDFHPEEDFAALFEASTRASRFTKGQAVEGTIVGIGAEVALIDIGSKSEAVLDVAELKDDDGALEAAVGDRISAVVIDTVGGLTLSRKLVRKAASDKEVEDAYHARMPVEGVVQGVVKGGYEVKVGRSRAFCPFSQIDTVRTENPEVHVGQTYTFRITEFKDAGRNIVVSRRTVLEAEQQARAEEVRRTIVLGAVLSGRVVSVPAFGAFVDLGGGVQGLLHVSEMGWSRIADASSAVAVGDEITVKVLRIESKNGEDKIALGLKQLTDDPWSAVAQKYPVGTVVRGRVTRLADFGAFVELEPGVTGLLPVTETAAGRGADIKKALPIGTTVDVIVLEIDAAGRRIRLSIKAIQDAVEDADVRDYAARTDAATKDASFGSLADKLKGALSSRDE